MDQFKFLFLFLFILCLASCEKESSSSSKENNTLNRINSFGFESGGLSDQDEECCSDLPEGHELNSNDLKFLNKIYKETNIEISFRTVVKQVTEYGHSTYAIKVPETLPFSFINIVTIIDEESTLLSETVNKYTFTPESANDFYKKGGFFSDFEGNMITYSVSEYFSMSRSDCEDLLPCCISNSGGNSGVGNTGGPGGGEIDVIDGAGCFQLLCIFCPCVGHGCTQSCSCKTAKPAWFIVPCPETLTGNSEVSTRNEDDCCPSFTSGGFPVVPDTNDGIFGNEDDDEPNNNDGINLACVASGYNFIQELNLPNTPEISETIETIADCLDCPCDNGANYNDCFSDQLLSDLSVEEQAWLNNPSNILHKSMVIKNKLKYSGDAIAEQYIKNHVLNLMTDSEYKHLVEASLGWSTIMWQIGKEIIGDKAVDILLGVVGADEIRDAIKALKNNDWLEFGIEVSKLVVQQTPVGKFLKILDAGSDMYKLAKKIEKIWDKIDGVATNIIEQMWGVVSKYGDEVKTNSALIGGLIKTIKRGLKSIDDVMLAIPGFTQMSNSRMKHILHGDTGGGLHHASGLVNAPSKKVIEMIDPNSKGVYKVRYEYLDVSGNKKTKLSSMFPDSKSEIGVAKSIENVYNNNISMPFTKNDFPGRRFIKGIDSGGIDIEIEIDIQDKVLSAYPLFN